MRFLNPKTDFAFKKIFGSQQSKPILIDFLNALLYEGRTVIEDLEIIDPYQAPQLQGMKDTFRDVKARITGNKTVIIEMQVLNVLGFKKRVLYNLCKAFSMQLDSGQGYDQVNPVIALTITDFEMFPDRPKVISHYQLKEREDATDYSEDDDIKLVFVELPKLKKPLEQLETVTDKWIYFLKEAGSLEIIPENLNEPATLERAFQIAQLSLLSREELDIFERKQLFLQDSRNAILKAEQDALQQGMQRGIQQGLQQGLQEGLQQGEKQKAEAIARSLLDILPIETISQTTGLSVEEIRQLR
ncbi:Rpn family recombination-promoting nuclease/putative transposase [Lyngbya sp. CCY1209]|uniref:Rpn family recombination-promoting nuclease/putative transposase n=1 Tax=Lyngbya sp. CCY1209 TaxID=2886103 RepID=UPI002D2151AA|nr:Rpn family recombination-promoting nuclease/putative transposase [Lyngbya sp. CCY1209]MEB3884255.1 Rpn family recombination-promoting nuclease/putative transposase [Lyngbya sp. CCY1209]